MLNDPIERLNLTLSAGAVAASWAFVSAPFAAALAVGAAVEALNFRAMRRGARAMLLGEHAGGWAVAGFGFRFALMALVIGVCIHQGFHPVGLVIGLSMIVPAALAGTWMQRPQPADVATLAAVPGPDDPSWDEWNPWLARERDPEREDDA